MVREDIIKIKILFFLALRGSGFWLTLLKNLYCHEV